MASLVMLLLVFGSYGWAPRGIVGMAIEQDIVWTESCFGDMEIAINTQLDN